MGPNISLTSMKKKTSKHLVYLCPWQGWELLRLCSNMQAPQKRRVTDKATQASKT